MPAASLIVKELSGPSHWARAEKRHNNPLLIIGDIAPGRLSASAQVTDACDDSDSGIHYIDTRQNYSGSFS